MPPHLAPQAAAHHHGAALARSVPGPRRPGAKRAAGRWVAAQAGGEEAPGEEIELETMDKMETTVEKTQGNLDTIRTGRANPAILDRLMVEYYGAETPLKTIAGVSTPDAQTLQIQPFDMGALPDIERAIMESDVGITPNSDGKVIRLTIPQLTKERRKDLAKQVSKLGEEGKVAIRNVRRDALKQIKKLEISEDAAAGLEADMQKLTDDSVKKIDEIVKAKETEISTV